jgi:hypothetical protein
MFWIVMPVKYPPDPESDALIPDEDARLLRTDCTGGIAQLLSDFTVDPALHDHARLARADP